MRSTAALVLLTFAFVVHALGYLHAAPEHVVDETWPLHARFHVMQALVLIEGIDLTMLLVIWGPLRRGSWWALQTLWVGGAVVHGSYFVAFVTGGQPPDTMPHILLGIVAGAWLLGMVLAERARRFG